MAKRTAPPLPCIPENCGDFYRKCGKLGTYTLGCRCDSCRETRNAYNRKNYAKDPEKTLKRARKWYADNADAVLDNKRDYYAANADVLRVVHRDYYYEKHAENRERARVYRQVNAKAVAERERLWRQANPEKVRAKDDARRALLLNAFVERVVRKVVFERDNWICKHCGIDCPKDAKHPAKNAPTVDHIIPLAKGGTHEYANVQLLCLSCNTSKGARFQG